MKKSALNQEKNGLRVFPSEHTELCFESHQTSTSVTYHPSGQGWTEEMELVAVMHSMSANLRIFDATASWQNEDRVYCIVNETAGVV